MTDVRQKLYRKWTDMRNRCLNPKFNRYQRYGGRGIGICAEWVNSFDNFYTDMAPSYTSGMSLERIDNDKDYSPANCRWASAKEQARNRSTNRMITYAGQTKTLAEWCEEKGLKRSTITMRLNAYGYTVAEALNTQTHKRRTI